MSRTQLRQAQLYNSGVSIQGFHDDLSTQLESSNNPELATGVELVASESITFSASGSVVTMSSNPLTAGVVPGDQITISASASDDGVYEITSVSSGTVTVAHVFAAGDGGYALGVISSVRDLTTDLNFLRAQVRKILGLSDWFSPPASAWSTSPILKNKKIIYPTENYTDIAVPAAGVADISSLSLGPYADQSTTNEGVLAETTTPTAGGAYKSEGKHWVDIVNAATGDPITIGGNRVYAYLVVDSISAPTTEELYFVYFDNSTDAEVMVTNLLTQQDAIAATNFEIIYNTRSNLADVPEEFGLHPTHIESSVDQFPTLQQSYVRGNTITLVDTEGDLIITLDDSGAAANFQVTDSGGDYIVTSAATNKLSLGSAANDVDVNGALAVTGSNTFDVGIGQSTFAGNVDADAGLDVTGVTNLGDGGVTNYAQFSATGDLSFVGTADTISKTDAALAVQTTGQNLTLQTVTSGVLAVNSAGVLDMDGASVTLDSAAGMSLDAAAASNVSVTGGNLTLSSITSGDVILSSAGELTFDDSHWSAAGLPFADVGNTAFTGSAAGAVSLVDAINQVAATAGYGEAMTQGDSTVGADVPMDTDFTIPGSLSYVLAADFVSDFVIFVNGQKMRNGLNSGANFDVYPGSSTTTIRFEFKLKAGDVVSAIKVA